MTSPLLNEREVASLLGISHRSLQAFRVKGGGPAYVKLTPGPKGLVRYRREDIEAYVTAGLRSSTSGVA